MNENPVKRRSWWSKAVLAIIVIAAPMVIHFRPVVWSSTPTDAAPEVKPIGRARVVCLGHVDLEEGVTALNPVQAGRVSEVVVREGQRVKAGAVLLRLDDQQARLLVREAEGELKAARARLAQARKMPQQHHAELAAQQAALEAARFRLAAARESAQRTRKLLKDGMAGSEEAATAENIVRELEAMLQAEHDKAARLQAFNPTEQVTLAEAEVEARQARLDEARHALSERAVYAPADGEVLRLLAAVGDVRGPQAANAAILFCPDRPRVVRAEVPQEFADRVRVGQTVVIQDDARLVEVGRGEVARVSDWYTQRRSVLQEPSVRNDVRTLECIIRITPGDSPLRIGQRVRVVMSEG
jgi:multidrug resistance efflux pump